MNRSIICFSALKRFWAKAPVGNRLYIKDTHSQCFKALDASSETLKTLYSSHMKTKWY